MSIIRFFDREVIVKRLKTITGSKKNFQSTATVEGHIQELDQEARQLLNIVEERGWIAWFAVDTDIREGDRITDDEGKTYHVREITKKEYGINQHLEVILMEQNS